MSALLELTTRLKDEAGRELKTLRGQVIDLRDAIEAVKPLDVKVSLSGDNAVYDALDFFGDYSAEIPVTIASRGADDVYSDLEFFEDYSADIAIPVTLKNSDAVSADLVDIQDYDGETITYAVAEKGADGIEANLKNISSYDGTSIDIPVSAPGVDEAKNRLRDLGDEGGFSIGKLKDAFGELPGPISGALDSAESLIGTVGNLGGGGVVAIGAFAGAAAFAAGKLHEFSEEAIELDDALIDLQVRTGNYTDTLHDLRRDVFDIADSGIVGTFESVAEAMGTVEQVTGLTGQALQDATKSSAFFAERIGEDVLQVILASSRASEQFNVDLRRVQDVMLGIAQQTGADDILDTFTEYPSVIGDAGFSIETFGSILIAAMDNGARNTDVAADAVKEFAIRVRDGSDSSIKALDDIGIGAEHLFTRFRNGATVADVFPEIISAIESVEDPISRQQIGVALLGTKYEDLGERVIFSLDDAAVSVNEFGGQTEEAMLRAQDSISALRTQNSLLKQEIRGLIGDSVVPLKEEWSEFNNAILTATRDFFENGGLRGGAQALVDFSEGSADATHETRELTTAQQNSYQAFRQSEQAFNAEFVALQNVSSGSKNAAVDLDALRERQVLLRDKTDEATRALLGQAAALGTFAASQAAIEQAGRGSNERLEQFARRQALENNNYVANTQSMQAYRLAMLELQETQNNFSGGSGGSFDLYQREMEEAGRAAEQLADAIEDSSGRIERIEEQRDQRIGEMRARAAEEARSLTERTNDQIESLEERHADRIVSINERSAEEIERIQEGLVAQWDSYYEEIERREEEFVRNQTQRRDDLLEQFADAEANADVEAPGIDALQDAFAQARQDAGATADEIGRIRQEIGDVSEEAAAAAARYQAFEEAVESLARAEHLSEEQRRRAREELEQQYAEGLPAPDLTDYNVSIEDANEYAKRMARERLEEITANEQEAQTRIEEIRQEANNTLYEMEQKLADDTRSLRDELASDIKDIEDELVVETGKIWSKAEEDITGVLSNLETKFIEAFGSATGQGEILRSKLAEVKSAADLIPSVVEMTIRYTYETVGSPPADAGTGQPAPSSSGSQQPSNGQPGIDNGYNSSATGGPVFAGESYLVGDRPGGGIVPGITELFVPDTSGLIVSGSQLQTALNAIGGHGQTIVQKGGETHHHYNINIYALNPGDAQREVEYVIREAEAIGQR